MKKGTILAGFGIAGITPDMPFPLGGMNDKKNRLADKVRDRLFARALAFSDGEKTGIIVSIDIVLIHDELREKVWQTLTKMGISFSGIIISATHTHSGPGGYWARKSAKYAMGKYRQDIFDLIADGACDAAAKAVKDLEPAKLSFGETETEGLNYNRRHKDGPIDRTMGLLSIEREGKNIEAVFFGAHPVVTAFREYHTASADYPGDIIKSLEEKGVHGMFMVGPVGGVNALFPEGPMDLEYHLALLNRLLMEQVNIARGKQSRVKGNDVAFSYAESNLSLTMPKLFPIKKWWGDILLLPLRIWLYRFG